MRTERVFDSCLIISSRCLLVSLFSVLRDNPLICSCELYWLKQWQERGDLDNQMLSCLSDGEKISLFNLMIENCSEYAFHCCKRFDTSQSTGFMTLPVVYWQVMLHVCWLHTWDLVKGLGFFNNVLTSCAVKPCSPKRTSGFRLF